MAVSPRGSIRTSAVTPLPGETTMAAWRQPSTTWRAVTQTPENELKLAIPSDVSFDTGRSAIKPNFAPILNQFANSLRNNPNAEVRIIGHTDSTGTDAINNPLSVDRAASTRDYLIARGVQQQAFRIEGRGSHEPIADNNSDAGRAQNRRVEIYVGERSPG